MQHRGRERMELDMLVEESISWSCHFSLIPLEGISSQVETFKNEAFPCHLPPTHTHTHTHCKLRWSKKS